MAKYGYTGNNVPIGKAELVEHVENELSGYDVKGYEYDYNPYSDPILYQMHGGRIIQVPPQIQAEVIDRHRPLAPINDNEIHREDLIHKITTIDSQFNLNIIICVIVVALVLMLLKKNRDDKSIKGILNKMNRV